MKSQFSMETWLLHLVPLKYKERRNKTKTLRFLFLFYPCFCHEKYNWRCGRITPVPRVACYGGFAPYITVICLFVRVLLITHVPFPHSPPCPSCTHYLVLWRVLSLSYCLFYLFFRKCFNAMSYVCSTYRNNSCSVVIFL